jgi:hypothetical protein
VVVIILIFIGAAVAFVYRGTIFKSKNDSTTAESNPSPAKAQTPPKPVVVAPPASDTNWMLKPRSRDDSRFAGGGRIHGQDFLAERASFSTNGTLTIRAGTRGAVDFGMTVNFNGAAIESLAGQSINVATNAEKAARVTLRWRDGGQTARENFDGGYALRLEFGALANNRHAGENLFCAPDDLKSYVMGTFNIEIRKPRPPKPKP